MPKVRAWARRVCCAVVFLTAVLGLIQHYTGAPFPEALMWGLDFAVALSGALWSACEAAYIRWALSNGSYAKGARAGRRNFVLFLALAVLLAALAVWVLISF